MEASTKTPFEELPASTVPVTLEIGITQLGTSTKSSKRQGLDPFRIRPRERFMFPQPYAPLHESPSTRP